MELSLGTRRVESPHTLRRRLSGANGEKCDDFSSARSSRAADNTCLMKTNISAWGGCCEILDRQTK